MYISLTLLCYYFTILRKTNRAVNGKVKMLMKSKLFGEFKSHLSKTH